METRVLLKTNIPDKKLFVKGKVRDIWEIPASSLTNNENLLLMITTDRISAFDVVMSRGIPELGKIRNQISLFWFNKLKDICPNHIFSDDQHFCASLVEADYRESNDLIGRCVLVYPAKVFPVECVVRGYLVGSAWESYQETGKVCGISLSAGLKKGGKLSQPIFTPAIKARTGHDENIDFETMVAMVGKKEVAEQLRDLSLQLYQEAYRWTMRCGIVIVDTKFEFGLRNDQIIVVDELLTPDSSRFWDIADYKPEGTQISFDKQPLRDWLNASGWNKQPPAPPLPDEVVEETKKIYIEAYERLVGKTWPPGF
ncbi:MAG: phosphoribosylaminoimidazolesuccinocarboxamide synthase [Patescibacteria group bacterium]|nr:phosphoribosylaminoimidazolesuccinocarboxamide synthase [Patescibacteria group bacterium]